MNYPESIVIDERVYPLDTDFRVALRCLDIIDDDSIGDNERALAVVYCLLRDLPSNEDYGRLLQSCLRYLSHDRQEETNEAPGMKDMDFHQDERYILASFWHDYQIDLAHISYLHWWEYLDLLDGLSGDCVLNRIREIRTCDLNEYKGKAREKLAKAKRQVALKTRISAREQEAIDRFNALLENKPAQEKEG